MARLTVRNTQLSDVPALTDLQRRIYPTIEPWSVDRFARQIEVFPHGQLVALHDDRVVGCASSLVVLWDDWDSEHTWRDITASGTFDTHSPEGRTLYAAEVFVDPRLRGKRVGHALYEGRRVLSRRMNLKRIIACGRLPGYHRHAGDMSVQRYAMKVVWGDLQDPVLNFQLREGFDFCGVIENYLPEDRESRGHASLIVWLNPHYDPSRPTIMLPPPEDLPA